MKCDLCSTVVAALLHTISCFLFLVLGFTFQESRIISMGSCKKDVTPLLQQWGYVFRGLTHRYYSKCTTMNIYIYKRLYITWIICPWKIRKIPLLVMISATKSQSDSCRCDNVTHTHTQIVSTKIPRYFSLSLIHIIVLRNLCIAVLFHPRRSVSLIAYCGYYGIMHERLTHEIYYWNRPTMGGRSNLVLAM